MDPTALFKISYGLFLAGVEEGGKVNACIINTAQQVTAVPNRVVIGMQKQNYTAEMIRKKNSLAVSVLDEKTSLDFVQNFGARSGRDVNKFEGITYALDHLGNPYIQESMTAYFSLSVSETIDLDTHWLFVCEIPEAEVLSNNSPMTYQGYRNLKRSGKSEINSSLKGGDNMSQEVQYVCSVCHYVYDGDTPFEELPDDYECPICGQTKEVFVQE